MLNESQNDILVQTLNADCPLCGIKHEVELHKKTVDIKVKGDQVSTDEYYCLCPVTKNEKNTFIPRKLNESNEMRLRNAYRKKKGLLTSEEIVAIRTKYGVTQVELAKLLGLGEATISRYESKAIQDETYDSLLRFIDESPLGMLRFMKKNRYKFSEDKFSEIDAKLIKNHDEYGMELMNRQALQSDYVHYWYPSDYNGNKHLSIRKIESLATYFATGNESLHKIRLMFLYWYSDSLYYAKYGKSITGLTYRHESVGIIPVGHDNILKLSRINCTEEYDNNLNSVYIIKPHDKINVSELNSEELSLVSSVSKRFRTTPDTELSALMRREKAYLNSKMHEIIPYSKFGN